MALSAAQLAKVDQAITNILDLIITVTSNGPLMDYSDNGESVSQGAYLGILTARLRELRQMKVTIGMFWLGTNYRTTRPAVADQIPAWLDWYL